MCLSLICRLTCHGHFRSAAGSPPTILMDLWPHPAAGQGREELTGTPLPAPPAEPADAQKPQDPQGKALSLQTRHPTPGAALCPLRLLGEWPRVPSELKRWVGAPPTPQLP